MVSKPFHHFFYSVPATSPIHSLSLHDALPISQARPHRSATVFRRRERVLGRDPARGQAVAAQADHPAHRRGNRTDRKSTRLNSSHVAISYAVFCLKKRKVCDGEFSTCRISPRC